VVVVVVVVVEQPIDMAQGMVVYTHSVAWGRRARSRAAAAGAGRADTAWDTAVYTDISALNMATGYNC